MVCVTVCHLLCHLLPLCSEVVHPDDLLLHMISDSHFLLSVYYVPGTMLSYLIVFFNHNLILIILDYNRSVACYSDCLFPLWHLGHLFSFLGASYHLHKDSWPSCTVNSFSQEVFTIPVDLSSENLKNVQAGALSLLISMQNHE